LCKIQVTLHPPECTCHVIWGVSVQISSTQTLDRLLLIHMNTMQTNVDKYRRISF